MIILNKEHRDLFKKVTRRNTKQVRLYLQLMKYNR